MTTRYFGCHVSSAGGLHNALLAGKELGVNTIQIHPSPPQRWNSKAAPPGTETEFLAVRKDSGVEKLFFHGIYLINLANPDPLQINQSRQSLVHHLDLAARLKCEGVIFHVGSSKHVTDEQEGLELAAKSINWILDNSPSEGKLILEVAAGSGAVIGDRMEELRTIYDKLNHHDRVGFGLDSQHMWASGYDLRENLESVVSDVERIFGLDKVWAIHLNDSKTELGSRKDRHENIGDGLIGLEGMTRIFMHPKFAKIPFILETPGLKAMDTAKIEVEKLKAML